MNAYLAVLFLAGVALLQTTLAPHLTFRGAKPDFMLLVVISWSLLRGGREGMVWGFFGGLMLDLLSGGPFGVFTLSLVLIGYLSGLGENSILRGHVLLPVLVVLLVSPLYNITVLALFQLLGRPVLWEAALRHVIWPAAVLDLLALPVVYLSLRRLHRLTAMPQMEW